MCPEGPSEEHRAELGLGSVVAERYRLVRELGRGAMGTVFEAEGPSGARVALKSFFRISGGKEIGDERARFLREASVNRSLVGENIVSVSDHGFDPETGTAFMIMDLLVGEDLESAIERVGPLDPRTAVTIVMQACKGLEIAHRAGVVHRDLKPSNLFLHAEGKRVTAKVCDFGIAKVLDQASLTETGSVMGSPLYMPPEQLVNSKSADARSDVWSMAMTLYHALAGVAAFDKAPTFAQLVLEISRGQVPPLQDLAPWVSPELARVVHGALLVDRSARCPGAREFGRALGAVAQARAVLTVDVIATVASDVRATFAPKTELAASWSAALPASMPRDLDDDPLLGATLAERYRLVGVLGRGGMGAVYRAEAKDGADVAVKVMRSDLNGSRGGDALRRFVREARASQGIDSPHIACILDAGADEALGVPFIVMELLKGRDLGHLLKDSGPLEPGAIVPAFVQISDGLAAAHARGIVHRDIKPANIFLHETPGGEIVAKVCDFGVAKQLAATEDATELTRTGGMLGSPMYMSPEQAQNAKNVDHRSDVWSVGVSLYEALTGQKPWEGSTMGELILAICTRDLQPIRELAPWVDPELARVVHKATARDVKARYASAADLASALRPFAAGGRMDVESLRAISPERRLSAAAARSSPAAFNTLMVASTVNGDNSAVSIAERPRRRSSGALVAGGALIAIAATFWLATHRAPAPPDPSPVAVQASPAPAPPPAKTKARVSVYPRDATVRVNGATVALDEGDAIVEGAPGDIFRIVADSPAGGHAEVSVAITNDGRAMPGRVEIPPPVAASSRPRASSARPAAPTSSASGSVKSPDHPPTHPPPAAAPSAPSLQTTWE